MLHLIDGSHPYADDQADAALEVLKELGAEKKPMITIVNKIDQCENNEMLNRQRIKFTKIVKISALKRIGFEELEESMIEELQKFRKVVTLRIPQSEYAIVSEVIRNGNVLEQDYEGNDVILKVDLPTQMAGRLRKYIE